MGTLGLLFPPSNRYVVGDKRVSVHASLFFLTRSHRGKWSSRLRSVAHAQLRAVSWVSIQTSH